MMSEKTPDKVVEEGFLSKTTLKSFPTEIFKISGWPQVATFLIYTIGRIVAIIVLLQSGSNIANNVIAQLL